MNRLAIQQAIDVRVATTVAAEQAMLAEEPQVARLRDRLVRVGHALLDLALEQLGQLGLVETEQLQVEAAVPQLAQFDRQQVVVPLGQVGELVVGDPVGPDLLGREVLGHVHRHLIEPELLGYLPARMAADDHAIGQTSRTARPVQHQEHRKPGLDAASALPDRFDSKLQPAFDRYSLATIR
ncbi:MAG: hypothetical protein ACE5K7_01355 [Phycisphaerae bacterium]